MAGSKTGTSTIYHLAKKICKMVNVYGASDLASRTSSDFAAAVAALVLRARRSKRLTTFHSKLTGLIRLARKTWRSAGCRLSAWRIQGLLKS